MSSTQCFSVKRGDKHEIAKSVLNHFSKQPYFYDVVHDIFLSEESYEVDEVPGIAVWSEHVKRDLKDSYDFDFFSGVRCFYDYPEELETKHSDTEFNDFIPLLVEAINFNINKYPKSINKLNAFKAKIFTKYHVNIPKEGGDKN